jgi:uncharacterized repeat protein (TIGR01451 family)
VVIDESVPANSTFNAAGSSAGWSCANGSPAGASCTLSIGALAAGASGTASFAVTVISPVPAGTSQLVNGVSISDGVTSAGNADTTPLNPTPGLSLSKSDGGASVAPGATVVYALNYQNTGNIGLTGILINEIVPANTTFNAASSSGSWSCANGSPAGTACSLTIGSLAGGASGLANFAVKLNRVVPAGTTQIANNATIAASDGTTDSDNDTTPVTTTPALSLTKSDGGVSVVPGGGVSYILTYQNSGNVDLTGVVIDETVPANTAFNAAASSAGWSCGKGAPAGAA